MAEAMNVEIGKYTLESLTTGMYSEPKIVYREYIQNSVDALEMAVEQHIIEEQSMRIDIIVDAELSKIIVRDNGIGISKEDLERVFERFYRVDKARSREQGGTGLGLSIAKEIMERNGGSIDITSDINQGTEVILRLPVIESKNN